MKFGVGRVYADGILIGTITEMSFSVKRDLGPAYMLDLKPKRYVAGRQAIHCTAKEKGPGTMPSPSSE